MKALLPLLWFATCSLAKDAPYEAHEWGTFTMVVGSDGQPVPWWTPNLEGPATLPVFVKPVFSFTKAALGPQVLRMETPVVYFYAKQPMDVSFTASFSGGQITEAYPQQHAFGAMTGQSFMGGAGLPVIPTLPAVWKVKLQPPDHPDLALMPPVGKQGAHYAHAREVPDAWLVHATRGEGETRVEEVDKFIFYRGAGTQSLPIQVNQSSAGRVKVSQYSDTRAASIWHIRVTDQGMSWSESTRLDQGESGAEETLAPLNAPQPSALAIALLEPRLRAALVQSGLTSDEAAAMTSTWREAWLTEPGSRLLYILPRRWVDSVLPVTLQPKPSKLERAFVARVEMIEPDTEQKLLTLLDSVKDDAQLATEARQLQLGRFLPAAFERAVKMYEMQARSKAAKITAALQPSAR
jgi:hypothetical protein